MPRYILRTSCRRRDGRDGPSFGSAAIEAESDAAAIVVAELNGVCPDHMQRVAAILVTAGGVVIWSAKGLPLGERSYPASRIGLLQA